MLKNLDQEDTDSEDDINMTPMLDVVFILLIFFIVTSHFTRDTGIKLDRPSAETAQATSADARIISLTENGEIWFANQAIALSDLSVRLGGVNTPETSALIVVDQQAGSGRLVAVMDELRKIGIHNISIAAKQKSP